MAKLGSRVGGVDRRFSRRPVPAFEPRAERRATLFSRVVIVLCATFWVALLGLFVG